MKNNSKIIEVDGAKFIRIPLKTKILTTGDDILSVVQDSIRDKIKENDVITISESPLAITQGRAIPINELKIGWLAKFLWRFVSKVDYGIGLRSPESMQCAIDECGSLRVLFAAIIGGLGRFLGRRGKGDFYRLAGKQTALIDAATTSPVPPYENCVIKGPRYPEKVSQMIKEETGFECCVMDINDIGGCWMIGGSTGINKHFMEKVMEDNPQGQGDELTPICLVRKVL
ncbi:MAG: coenzyme F420-0:L-glutamate ligase [Candidatus Cloacimonetes bacterium]|nr:coenzyme F420-0:L-glutamate ligase [Candidatus Cloacimonadota bacterium]